MVNCALKTFKYVIFLMNFLVFSLSVAVAAAAGVFLAKLKNPYTEALGDMPTGSLYLLVAVSVVAIIISFLGCCGAAQESPCMLYTYGTVVFLLLVTEVVCGGLVVGFRNDMEQVIKKGLYAARDAYENKTDKYKPIDDIQHTFKCCGVDNINDWDQYRSSHDDFLPASCCAKNSGLCDPKEAFNQGCWSVLSIEFGYIAKVAGIVAISVAFIQLVAVIGTCLLARAFKTEYEVV